MNYFCLDELIINPNITDDKNNTEKKSNFH